MDSTDSTTTDTQNDCCYPDLGSVTSYSSTSSSEGLQSDGSEGEYIGE